jgi:SAM-dependent methyltransferase
VTGVQTCALSVNVWFHLSDLDKAALELSRVLKKGGKFNIVTSNPDNYEAWRNFFENPIEEGKLISGKVSVPVNPLTRNDIYMYTKQEMINSFEKAGLEIIRLQPLGTISKYPNNPLFISIQGAKKF